MVRHLLNAFASMLCLEELETYTVIGQACAQRLYLNSTSQRVLALHYDWSDMGSMPLLQCYVSKSLGSTL